MSAAAGPRPRSPIRILLDWAFLAVGVAAVVWYVGSFPDELERIAGFGLGSLALLSAFVIASHVLVALKLQRSVAIFGEKIALRDAFYLVQAGGLLNIVPLHMGTALRATYLKKVVGLRYVNFGLGTIVTQFTSFLAASAVGIACTLSLSGAHTSLLLLFAAYLMVPIGIVVLGGLARATAGRFARGRWRALASSADQGVREIAARPREVALWFGLDLLANVALGTRFFLVAAALSYAMPWLDSLTLQATTRIASIATVMPSGMIGLREGLSGLGATALGNAAITGVMIASVDRVVAIGWVILLGSVSLRSLRRQIRDVA